MSSPATEGYADAVAARAEGRERSQDREGHQQSDEVDHHHADRNFDRARQPRHHRGDCSGRLGDRYGSGWRGPRRGTSAGCRWNMRLRAPHMTPSAPRISGGPSSRKPARVREKTGASHRAPSASHRAPLPRHHPSWLERGQPRPIGRWNRLSLHEALFVPSGRPLRSVTHSSSGVGAWR